MSISFEDLANNERILRIKLKELNEEEVEIVYRPLGYTLRQDAEIKRMINEGNLEWLAEFLSSVLVRWDVVENGKPVSITRDKLLDMPIWFLNEIVRGIYKDMQVGDDDVKNSGGGSPRKVK